MRTCIAFLLVAALVPATVFGGGGTKATARIHVKNLGGEQFAVIVDPPAGFNPANLQQFTNAGGKVINTNETASFSVKQGAHIIAGAFINAAAGAPGPNANLQVTSGNNSTIRVEARGTSAAAPQLQIVP